MTNVSMDKNFVACIILTFVIANATSTTGTTRFLKTRRFGDIINWP